CIRVTSQWFANWPKAYAYVQAPSVFTAGLYYLVLLTTLTGWLFVPKLRAWKVSALGLLVIIWCWQEWPTPSLTRLTIPPAGGGTAIYCDSPCWRHDLLLDCGMANAV